MCNVWHAGRKSRIESFAGANVTFTIEAMMGDRRALQVLYKLYLPVFKPFARCKSEEEGIKLMPSQVG